MSAFDLQLKIMAVGVNAPTEEQRQAGAPSEVEIVLTCALLLPSPQGMVPVPLGTLRFGLAPEDAEKIGEQFQSEAAKLPKTSDIAVASDLSGIEGLAKATQQFKQGPNES